MQLVAPDLLADLCGLSPGLIGVAAAVGAALWLLGWWSHRFWVVLAATVLAGVVGLYEAPLLKAQPLIASLLLALAAGFLALALIRLFAFVVGGFAGMALAQSLAPSFDQPVIVFLVCGLLGLLLFRWCVTALMSFSGSVLLVYAGLILLNHRGALDAPAYAERSGSALTIAIVLMSAVGFAVQIWMERRRRKKAEEKDEIPVKKPRVSDDPYLGMFNKRKAG